MYAAPRFVKFYFVRFWPTRRSGVTLAITHKAGFVIQVAGMPHAPKGSAPMTGR